MSSSTVPAGLGALPPEVVVEHIVPHLANRDVSALAHTTGTLLRHLQHKRLYHFWPRYNRKYVEDASFRDEVGEYIPVDRIVLIGWRGLSDLGAFRGVHTADITACEGVRCDDDALLGVASVLLPRGFQSFAALTSATEVIVRRSELGARAIECLASVRVLSLEDCAVTCGLGALRNVRSLTIDRCRCDVSPSAAASLASLRAVSVTFDPSAPQDPPSLLERIVDSDTFTRLRTVTLHHSPLRAVPPELGRVYALDLSYSKFLHDLAAITPSVHTAILRQCRAIKDVSPLSRAHTVDLWRVGDSLDVSPLSNAHTLSLSRVDKVVGISALGAVHSLNLSDSRISSVRGLGSVHTLNLSGSDVQDVSELGGVHTLILGERVKCGFETLGSVHTLTLHSVPPDFDMSLLGGVHALQASLLPDTIERLVLPRVHTLTTTAHGVKKKISLPMAQVVDFRSHFLTDATPFAHVRNVTLRRCHKIADVRSLAGVHSLTLEGCRGVCDVSSLANVHALTLTSCPMVANVSALGRVHTLSLAGCEKVADVSALGSVHSLNLNNCRKVSDVSALGGVHTLSLANCVLVKDVSALGRVCVLDVRGCRGIADRSPLSTVRKLIEIW